MENIIWMYFFHRFQFKLMRVLFFSERNTPMMNHLYKPMYICIFFYLHISHDVPTNILIPLCYMSYINWTSLHVVSLLIRFAYTYCTHSLSDANRTDSDNRSAASTVCQLRSPSACYVELQNNWCLTFSLSNIKDSLQWSGPKRHPKGRVRVNPQPSH